MECAAIDRALALSGHAKYLGAPVHEFTVLVSTAEAFELIDWLLSDSGPQSINRDLVMVDAACAVANNNPWIVLDHFELMGMRIGHAVETLQ